MSNTTPVGFLAACILFAACGSNSDVGGAGAHDPGAGAHDPGAGGATGPSGAGGAGGTGAGAPDGCVDYGSIDPNACDGGACAFETIVVEVFQTACAFSACHSRSAPVPQEGLGLAPQIVAPSAADLDAIHAAIVGAPSKRSSLKRVAPGDPARSWLMAKIDYKFSPLSGCASIDEACASGKGCGVQMPNGSPLAPDDPRRAMLRAWIAAGAPR